MFNLFKRKNAQRPTRQSKWPDMISLREAAERGVPDAQFNLGMVYDMGDRVPHNGVQFDASEAVKWFRKAAEQGHARAQLSLGIKYIQGMGVAEDVEMGTHWMRLAASNGVAEASAFLDSTPATNHEEESPLHFKSGEAAFEMICKYMENPLEEGSCLPALVLEASEKAIKIVPEGHPFAMIRVASSDGGFVVPAPSMTANGPSLSIGQLVLWRALEFNADIAQGQEDQRFGWVGVIIATLKPVFVPGKGWAIDEKYSQ